MGIFIEFILYIAPYPLLIIISFFEQQTSFNHHFFEQQTCL